MDNSLVQRNGVVARMTRNFRVHPAVSVLGPRQCGKTTLSRFFSQNVAEVTYFDMERHQDRRLMDNAEFVLLDQTGTVVIDEVQRVPELFETLRVVIDHPSCTSKYLLLGSVSPSLVKGVSESLAGRVGMIDLSGFSIEEVSWIDWKKLWSRGGFPRNLLADIDEDSMIWRDNFLTTFLERDVRQFGYSIPPDALRRFWTMLVHYHGQIWNGAEFARAIGQSENAARRILDILSSTYMVRVLYPWHQNLKNDKLSPPKFIFAIPGCSIHCSNLIYSSPLPVNAMDLKSSSVNQWVRPVPCARRLSTLNSSICGLFIRVLIATELTKKFPRCRSTKSVN